MPVKEKKIPLCPLDKNLVLLLNHYPSAAVFLSGGQRTPKPPTVALFRRIFAAAAVADCLLHSFLAGTQQTTKTKGRDQRSA
jgi:hypothetical protein